jgi:hypothetical protein
MNIRGCAYRSIPLAGYIAAMLCLSLITLSCVTNNPVDPMDPNVKPAVMSTFPQNGEVGPFNIYSTANTELAHFYVHFNKMINLTTVSNASVTCEGFGKRVYVRPLSSVHYGGISAEIVAFGIYQSQYGDTGVAYEVGKEYIITIDTAVTDFSNLHPAYPYSFSFRPEPLFRAIGTSVLPEDTLTPGNNFIVYFNSPIDSGIIPFLSFTPSVPVAWHFDWSEGAQHFNINCYGWTFHACHAYTLQVAEGAQDRAGNVLLKKYTSSFHTRPLSIVYYIPYFNYSLSGRIDIQFSAAVDTNSLYDAFSITPPTPGRVLWSSQNNGFTFYPENDWIPSTLYTVRISTQLRDLDGNTLASPMIETAISTTFHVTWCYFDSTSDAYHAPNLTVGFSGKIDFATVKSGFSISPTVSGYFYDSYYTNEFTFYPDKGFDPATTYKVSLSKAIHSKAGYELAEPASFTFTTSSANAKR